ncbi:MAG: STAS domain-containing protein [Planctomycetota bacterium]|nr:STAS domain-containing protein [Planctomycetota bacterium]
MSRKFTLKKNVLHALGDLYWESLQEFAEAGERLLQSREAGVTLDFSGVSYISSPFIGAIGDLIARAVRLRKRVVVRAGIDISWLFEVMGARDMFTLETV